MRGRVWQCYVCVGLWFAAACHANPEGTAPAPLLVYAAASLTDVLEALRPGMEAASNRPVRITTASSGTLARQILSGAPADIFISAHPVWMDELADAGLLAAPGTPWLGNRLVCVVPRDADGALARPADLDSPSIHTIALAADTAPVGAYARAALAASGVTPRARVVEGLNARDTLAKVALGGAQAAIVYATDVRLEPRVRVAFTFDSRLHPSIEYPLAVLGRASNPGACEAVVSYLQGGAARKLLTAHGFAVLPMRTDD